MKWLIVLLLTLFIGCSNQNICEYEISARYVSELETIDYRAMFQENGTNTYFVVKFDSQQFLNLYKSFNGELSLNKKDNYYVLCN